MFNKSSPHKKLHSTDFTDYRNQCGIERKYEGENNPIEEIKIGRNEISLIEQKGETLY